MTTRQRLGAGIGLACLIGIALTLAGCGQSGANAGATSATPLPTATPGLVALVVSATTYSANSSIQITITNGTSATIHFNDHQSNCTVIELQRQMGAGWETVNKCKVLTPTRDLTLGAGKTMAVTLQPVGNGWAAGTYRAALRYWTDASTVAKSSVAYSAGFHVS